MNRFRCTVWQQTSGEALLSHVDGVRQERVQPISRETKRRILPIAIEQNDFEYDATT